MKKTNFYRYFLFIVVLLSLYGCEGKLKNLRDNYAASNNEEEAGMQRLSISNEVFKDFNLSPATPEESYEVAPIFLKIGSVHENVKTLQTRLMELGYMENAEPSNEYFNSTAIAVAYFERQLKVTEDGICGPSLWNKLMDKNAPPYSVTYGNKGEDVRVIQSRLYELGYLYKETDINGVYDDNTRDAVLLMQRTNEHEESGIIDSSVLNYIYSEDIIANIYEIEKNKDVVSTYQDKLKNLGYYTGVINGDYDDQTRNAVKSFQSLNNIIVDGYLGPDTRNAIDSSDAVPYAISIGDTSEFVKIIQQKLVDYGYLTEEQATGYYGAVTANAIKSFQGLNNLTIDGSVGAKTLAKLTGDAAVPYTYSDIVTEEYKTENGTLVKGNTQDLLDVAISKIGTPYVWGKQGPNQFDCSGFVYWCLNQINIKISYMTTEGWKKPGRFQKVKKFSDLQAGDIIVVTGHMGIVSYNHTVIDASSSDGMVVHRNLTEWWEKNFKVGWRIFE